MLLRRITLAAALAILPAVRAATDFGDWLRDPLADDALWLYGSGNLAFEAAPADLPPRTPAKRWIYARDGQPAAVVYFVPGSIRTIEVDTHRRPGATGDFTLSTSVDGRRWEPLPVTAATLEEAAGWQYRLLAVDSVPGEALHLRIEFPADATAATHRLTEVWIRFDWEPALLADETPAPAPSPALPRVEPTIESKPTTVRFTESVPPTAAPAVAASATSQTEPTPAPAIPAMSAPPAPSPTVAPVTPDSRPEPAAAPAQPLTTPAPAEAPASPTPAPSTPAAEPIAASVGDPSPEAPALAPASPAPAVRASAPAVAVRDSRPQPARPVKVKSSAGSRRGPRSK